jgi:predicted nucleic acid-binding protein
MKRTVVDTSVWRAFFSGRGSASRLGDLLEESGVVLLHPLVIGELVLGGLSPAEERLLQRLPQAEPSGYANVLAAIRRYKLARRGIGWVDAELVTSALRCRAQLWTLDRSLSSVADELGVAFGPTVPTS